MLKSFTLILPALFTSLYIFAQNNIPIEEVSKHIGQTVTICDKIYEGKFVENSETKSTLLTMGRGYSKHSITIVINFNDRKNFTEKPEIYYLQKDVCITGRVIEVKGKPQIIIHKPTEIQIGSE